MIMWLVNDFGKKYVKMTSFCSFEQKLFDIVENYFFMKHFILENLRKMCYKYLDDDNLLLIKV